MLLVGGAAACSGGGDDGSTAAGSAVSADDAGANAAGAATPYKHEYLTEIRGEDNAPDLHVTLSWTGGATNPIPFVGTAITASYTIGDQTIVHQLAGTVTAASPESPNRAYVSLTRDVSGNGSGAFELTARRLAEPGNKSIVDFIDGTWTSADGVKHALIDMEPTITVVYPSGSSSSGSGSP
jgi:hypothetical protein